MKAHQDEPFELRLGGPVPRISGGCLRAIGCGDSGVRLPHSRSEQVPQRRRALSRHPLGHNLAQAAEHGIGEQLAHDVPYIHRRRMRGVENAALGSMYTDGIERASVVRDVRSDDAPHPERGVRIGVGHRDVDAPTRLGSGAGEIYVDAVVGHGQGAHDVDRLFDAVDTHCRIPGSVRQFADRAEHGMVRRRDDVAGQFIQISHGVLVHHRDEACRAGLVAGCQGVNVPDDLDGVTNVGLDDRHDVRIEDAVGGELQDRQVETLVVHLFRVGSETGPADVHDMAGAGEQRNQLASQERRRDHHDVEQVAGSLPGIVGEEDVARSHLRSGELLEEMQYRIRHGIHMAGRAGHGLGEHPALRVEDARGQVAGLTGRRAEGSPHERPCLFLGH